MVDYRTEEKVRAAAIEFRKKHSAMDWSADVNELIKLHGYSQDIYPTFSLVGLGRFFKNAANDVISSTRKVAQKVKALVSVREKVILVASDLNTHRIPFAKAHEVGHSVLPWHKEILYVCDEGDLSLKTQEQFEFEANTFASELLLPRELLAPFYSDEFPISLETVLLIRGRSGASIEASANAYVRYHPKPVALLTLKDLPVADEPLNFDALFSEPDPDVPRIELVRKMLSPRAKPPHPLSSLDKGQRFGSGHVIHRLSRVTNEVQTGKLHTTSEHYDVTILNNTYSTLCLMSEHKS